MGVRLVSSVYTFDQNVITIAVAETRADGSVRPGNLELTPDEVQAYFDTPPSPYGFRATFVLAFEAAVQARYGAAVVTR